MESQRAQGCWLGAFVSTKKRKKKETLISVLRHWAPLHCDLEQEIQKTSLRLSVRVQAGCLCVQGENKNLGFCDKALGERLCIATQSGKFKRIPYGKFKGAVMSRLESGIALWVPRETRIDWKGIQTNEMYSRHVQKTVLKFNQNTKTFEPKLQHNGRSDSVLPSVSNSRETRALTHTTYKSYPLNTYITKKYMPVTRDSIKFRAEPTLKPLGKWCGFNNFGTRKGGHGNCPFLYQ